MLTQLMSIKQMKITLLMSDTCSYMSYFDSYSRIANEVPRFSDTYMGIKEMKYTIVLSHDIKDPCFMRLHATQLRGLSIAISVK